MDIRRRSAGFELIRIIRTEPSRIVVAVRTRSTQDVLRGIVGGDGVLGGRMAACTDRRDVSQPAVAVRSHMLTSMRRALRLEPTPKLNRVGHIMVAFDSTRAP